MVQATHGDHVRKGFGSHAENTSLRNIHCAMSCLNSSSVHCPGSECPKSHLLLGACSGSNAPTANGKKAGAIAKTIEVSIKSGTKSIQAIVAMHPWFQFCVLLFCSWHAVINPHHSLKRLSLIHLLSSLPWTMCDCDHDPSDPQVPCVSVWTVITHMNRLAVSHVAANVQQGGHW